MQTYLCTYYFTSLSTYLSLFLNVYSNFNKHVCTCYFTRVSINLHKTSKYFQQASFTPWNPHPRLLSVLSGSAFIWIPVIFTCLHAYLYHATHLWMPTLISTNTLRHQVLVHFCFKPPEKLFPPLHPLQCHVYLFTANARACHCCSFLCLPVRPLPVLSIVSSKMC